MDAEMESMEPIEFKRTYKKDQENITTQETTGESKKESEIDLGNVNEYGDALDQFLWDGPEDSDEEIADMVPLKEQWEIDEGVRFSKKGLIEYITKKLTTESPHNTDDP